MERLYGVKRDNYDYFHLTEEELEIVKRNCSEFLEGERLLKKIGRRLVRNDGDLFFSLRKKDAELLARIINGDGTLRRKEDWEEGDGTLRRKGDWEEVEKIRKAEMFFIGSFFLGLAFLATILKDYGVPLLCSDLGSTIFILLAALGGGLKASAAWDLGYRKIAVACELIPILLMLAWFS